MAEVVTKARNDLNAMICTSFIILGPFELTQFDESGSIQ